MGPRARWRNTRPTTSETCCGNSYSAASQIKPDAARPSLAPPRQIKPRGGAGCSFPRVLGTTPPEPFEMFLRSLWKFPAAACAISRGGLRNFLKRICCQKLHKNGPPGSRTRSVAQFPTAPLKLSCRPSRRFPLICRMPPGASAGDLHPCRPRRPLTAVPPGQTPLGHSFSAQWTLDGGRMVTFSACNSLWFSPQRLLNHTQPRWGSDRAPKSARQAGRGTTHLRMEPTTETVWPTEMRIVQYRTAQTERKSKKFGNIWIAIDLPPLIKCKVL